MKLTNKEVLKFLNTEFAKKKMPLKLSHAIILNTESLQPALKAIDSSHRALVEQYAAKDKNGDPVLENNEIRFDNVDNKMDFTKERNELMNLEIDASISTIPMEVLERCDQDLFDSLTLLEADALMFMVEGENNA